MTRQKDRKPGVKILWDEGLKIKGYIHYATLGLPQLYQFIQIESLHTDHNSRLGRFFESQYYYVLWWHSNSLYRCTKEQVIEIVNDMGYSLDSEFIPDDIFPTDIVIIGENFEASDILYFDHNEIIGLYQKTGHFVVVQDSVLVQIL